MTFEKLGKRIKEFAEQEGVSERTVRRWIAAGLVNYVILPNGRRLVQGWRMEKAGSSIPPSKAQMQEDLKGGTVIVRVSPEDATAPDRSGKSGTCEVKDVTKSDIPGHNVTKVDIPGNGMKEEEVKAPAPKKSLLAEFI